MDREVTVDVRVGSFSVHFEVLLIAENGSNYFFMYFVLANFPHFAGDRCAPWSSSNWRGVIGGLGPISHFSLS